VTEYKPNSEGVHRAMLAVGMRDSAELPHVLLVGDSDVDIRASEIGNGDTPSPPPTKSELIQ